MNQASNWFLIALVNFLIAGIFGVFLRLAFVTELPWIDFRNLMHGHSHVAMLGWLYLSLYILFLHYFIKDYQKKKIYQFLFIGTQVTVIGMSMSFPIQGYGGFSIAFSTLHVLLSYIFVYQFLRDRKEIRIKRTSVLFAKTALLLMILSTLGLFTMAPIMVMDLKTSSLYYQTVQFFLHFQFNGWFIFGVLALFFRILENSNIQINIRKSRAFYYTLLVSCILTYALAVTWSNPSPILFLTNSLGVLIQLIALFYFISIIKSHSKEIKNKLTKGVVLLLSISLISFSLKILVQSAVVIPYIAKIAYTIRNFVIGFIHLILLGAITFAIFAIASRGRLFSYDNTILKKGLVILTIGILLSELLLFLQGTMFWGSMGFIPFYYELLFGVSLLMPLGVAIIIFALLKDRPLSVDLNS